MQVLSAPVQRWSGVSELWFLEGNIRQRLLEHDTTPESEMSIGRLGNAKRIFIWHFLIKLCISTPPSYGVMCVGVGNSFEWLIKYCCALSDLWLNSFGTFNRILSFSVCVSSVGGGVESLKMEQGTILQLCFCCRNGGLLFLLAPVKLSDTF